MAEDLTESGLFCPLYNVCNDDFQACHCQEAIPKHDKWLKEVYCHTVQIRSEKIQCFHTFMLSSKITF